MLTYSSPQNFVVSHVLHRLLVPRHPPCALINLTFKLIHLSILVISIESFDSRFFFEVLYKYSTSRFISCYFRNCYSVFNDQISILTSSLTRWYLYHPMEPSGIEPLTSCVQSRRSPSWAKAPSSSEKIFTVLLGINLSKLNNTELKRKCRLSMNCLSNHFSLERRWSSRTFRYGYLVTTSPQSSILP